MLGKRGTVNLLLAEGVIGRFVPRITLREHPPVGIYARIFAAWRLRGRTLVRSAAPEFQS